MNFGSVKTTVESYLNRSDLTSVVPSFIQLAQKKLERAWDYNHMESNSTVAITNTGSEDDGYISRPTRYKSVKWMSVVDDNEYYRMFQTSTVGLLQKYPEQNDDRDRPEAFSSNEATDEFIIRPLPDQAYSIEAVTYCYTAELSADVDTNWWTENAWECLLFGALLESAPYLSTEDKQIQVWATMYADKVKTLQQAQKSERADDLGMIDPAYRVGRAS